ncbi:hypothetical protein [Actinoplanes sp. NPDC051411]|uniref:hypothetical protein n=1 Tax=Actinoplanes sp. NPDC051411 TaxID=3155522 RepID=UPI00343DEC73
MEDEVMHMSHRSEPDRERPTDEMIRAWRERMEPPENELPAGAALTVLLGRTDDVAVGITQVDVFTTGFRFTLAVRVRRPLPALAHGGLHRLVGGGLRHGVEVPLERLLLLGIEYANGDRASTLRDPHVGPGDSDGRLVLRQGGGGGSDRTVDHTFWVSPLPPDGPVTFVMAWPAFGVTESRAVIDSAPIRAAAGRAVALWPLQPVPEPEPPAELPRPATGWFAYG